MKVLFFDTECANCFDGNGKICELGYVLCDGDFNVLERDNLIINPNAEFDKKGFAIRKIKLSCPYGEYYKKETFPAFYEKIKALFVGQNDVLAVGHGTVCDIKYLLFECARYHLPLFDYPFIDTQELVRKYYNRETRLRLIEIYDDFFPDKAREQVHSGIDDAEMTAEILKYVCEDKKITPKDILQDSDLVRDVFGGRIVESNPFDFTRSQIMGKRNRKIFDRCAADNRAKCKGRSFSSPSEYEHKHFPQMMKLLLLMTEKGFRYCEGTKRTTYVTCGEKEWKLRYARKDSTIKFEEFLKLLDCSAAELEAPIDVGEIIAELDGDTEWYRGYGKYKNSLFR